MHDAFTQRFAPSPMNSPFNCSKTEKLREPPNWPSQPLKASLLYLSVTVTFGLRPFVFVHDVPLERNFSLCFSLVIGSFLFFFLFCCACMCQLLSRQKSDTARCHWQREVNSDIGARCHRQRSVLWNACTRVPDQNVCVTSRSMWEPLLSTVIWS